MTPATAGTGVLVLGVHRSGTSALTRALDRLGLATGRRDALMGPSESNRSGHWEITALTDCNDRLLRLAGGRWSGPPAPDADLVSPAHGELGAEARSLVAELLPDRGWAWKDPRLCLTLPFWRQVLGRQPTIVCLRHPVEVAASLQRRNGFSLPYGLALYERYLRSLLSAAAGTPALVVDYDELLGVPAPTIDAVATFVERHVGAVAGARGEAAASLDGAERHHHADAADLDEVEAGPELRALHEGAQALVGEHDALPALDLGPETPGLQLAFDEHARMSLFQDEFYRLRVGMDEARAGLDRQTLFFHQELERRSAEASALATDVMAAREQITELQAALDRMRGRLPIRVYLAARRRLPGGGN